MSPVPPQKDNISKSPQDDLVNNSNIPNAEANNEESEFEIIENTNNEDIYEPVPQDSQAGQNDEDEDEDDDSDDSDQESVEIDPDFDFELLASSRVSANSQPTNTTRTNTISYDNSHLFEVDIFERKGTLECEDIHLDESKTTKINSLMSSFKLPESAIPEWAKLVPENVWKKNLLDSLNAKKTDLFDLKPNQY